MGRQLVGLCGVWFGKGDGWFFERFWTLFFFTFHTLINKVLLFSSLSYIFSRSVSLLLVWGFERSAFDSAIRVLLSLRTPDLRAFGIAGLKELHILLCVISVLGSFSKENGWIIGVTVLLL